MDRQEEEENNNQFKGKSIFIPNGADILIQAFERLFLRDVDQMERRDFNLDGI